MAYSTSLHTAVAGSSTQFNRHSGSPPLQLYLSKRDKKRLNMAEKLIEISNNFAANRDAIYRKQLQTYQADINFIQSANPYENKPLDDPADDQSDEVAGSAAASIQGSLRHTQHILLNGRGRIEPTFKTGKYASKYVQEINDAMEKRDADLTTLAVRPPALTAYTYPNRRAAINNFICVAQANASLSSIDITSASMKFRRTMNTKLPSPTKSISYSLKLCANVSSSM